MAKLHRREGGGCPFARRKTKSGARLQPLWFARNLGTTMVLSESYAHGFFYFIFKSMSKRRHFGLGRKNLILFGKPRRFVLIK